MATINTAPSQVATSALESLPLENIIGAPLDACIKAQAQAAQTSARFIHEVGLQSKDDNGEYQAINVAFTFVQNGRLTRLNIPLLTIVPIPYIAIQDIDVAFKANINAASSSSDETTSNTEYNAELSGGGRWGWGLFGVNLNLKGAVSSKRDSRAAQDSKYCVEYTMDIGIHAGQDSMPGGMAKVLEILNNSITLSEPQGTLAVNANDFVIQENEDKKHAQLIVTYKSPEGIYEPDKITCKLGNDAQNGLLAGNSVVYMLTKTGTYTLTAGALKETVTVNSNKETTSDTKKDES